MSGKRLFSAGKPRYVTRGIHEKLPIEYQIILWEMVNELGKKKPLDYLQVFEFRVKEGEAGNGMLQIIRHFQEQPEYSNTYTLPVFTEAVTGKVYITDDGEYSTMLWAEEY